MPPRAISDDRLAWAVDQLRGRRRLSDVAADLGVSPFTLADALRRVGLTDPARTEPVDLGFRPPRRTAPSDPHVVGRVDRRRRRLRQIVAERGWPSGRAVDDVAAELGIHRRTAYGDLAAIAREARSRDDVPAPSAT